MPLCILTAVGDAVLRTQSFHGLSLWFVKKAPDQGPFFCLFFLCTALPVRPALRHACRVCYPGKEHVMTAYALLGLAIVAEVIGTSALKASAGFSRLGPSLLVVCGYGVAFYCLSLVMRSIPVGIA